MIKYVKNVLVTKSSSTLNSTVVVIQVANRFFKLLIFSVLFISCNYKNQNVDVKIVDPVRHYYPIIQGQELDILLALENSSDYPFKISDIHSSCGCVVIKKGTFNVIPAKSKGYVKLTYNSNKNVGLVNHFIYIYGNLNKLDKLEANFDVHVVPDALYTPDYEELYRREVKESGGVKNVVDGNENDKSYYINFENDLK